jgi:predicted porin
MKKTLIALAALAATGAFAQNVTISGNLDQSVYNNSTDNSNKGVAKSGWGSNNNSSSFWALNGTEDLGGGMKASFSGVSELTLMSGATGASIGSTGYQQATAQQPEVFNRGLNVSLEGGFGKVTIGKQADVWWATQGSFNTSGSNSLGSGNLANWAPNGSAVNTISGKPIVGMGGYAGTANAVNTGNAAFTGDAYAFAGGVSYTTPNMSGFQVQLQSNTATYSNGGVNTGNSYALSYANGPLKVAYASAAKNDDTGAANGWVNSFVGGSYQMGAYTFIVYHNTTQFGGTMAGNDNITSNSVGLNYVVSPKVDFNVAYGVATDDADSSNKATQLGVVGRYKLSARTSMYAGLGNMKNEGGAKMVAIYAGGNGDVNTTTNSYMLGLRHTF